MLLDLQNVRSILLRAPASGDEAASGEGAPVEAGGKMYSKFVNKELPKVELFLKLVATPRERLSEALRALWPEAHGTDIVRIMDLKGLKSKE